MAQEKLSRRPVWRFTFCDATCTLNISSANYKLSLNRVAHYCNFQWQFGEPPVLGPEDALEAVEVGDEAEADPARADWYETWHGARKAFTKTCVQHGGLHSMM